MGEYDDSFLGSNGADAVDLLSYIFSSLNEDVLEDYKDRLGNDTAFIYTMNYIQIEYIYFSQKIWNGYIKVIKNLEPIYAFENKCFIEFDLEDLLKKEKELDLNEFFNYYFDKKITSNEFCPKCNKNVKFDSKTNI